MNIENMKAWVEALRSGQYAQGKFALATETETGWEFCCLGVACEVAALNGVELEYEVVPQRVGTSTDGGHRELVRSYVSRDEDHAVDGHTWTDMPYQVADWLGLEGKYAAADPLIHIQGEDQPVLCSRANDAEGLTFEQIADALELTFALGSECVSP